MRTAAKTDSNQTEIVTALRQAGTSVAPTHQLGGGFVDLVCGHPREIVCPRCAKEFDILFNWLLEVKDGNKPPSKQLLTPDEMEFHRNWKGQIDIVHSAEETLRLIGALW